MTSETWIESFSSWIFRRRAWLLAIFALLTAVMTWQAAHLRVDASFNKGLPLEHPFIRTFTRHQAEFGGANRVVVALMAKSGDMFSSEFFSALRSATDSVASISGVDRAQVQSLFTPNVRFVEVVEEGFSGGNVIPADFTPGPAAFARVRENILKSGKLGQLVATDFSGAIVSANLLEIDPVTGRKLDYAQVSSALEILRSTIERESRGEIDVHVIGFAKVIGNISDGARGVLVLFGVSVVVTGLFVWAYAGRWKLALAPVVCSLVAVVWQLGALTTLGHGLDPFSILVPFLVFAIGVSHGVQKICTFRNEVFKGHDGPAAAHAAFVQLIVPGIVALLTDTVGFITMLVIQIQTIHELAITASLGVGVIVITNFFLLPILLSYLELPASYSAWVAHRRERLNGLWTRLIQLLRPAPSLAIVLLSFALGAWAWGKAEQVHVGDTGAGVPELRSEARYNRDSRLITSKFSIGVDVLSIIVECAPNGSVDHEVVALMDEFEGTMRDVPGVQSIVSLVTVAKTINAGFNEGSLKWRVIPRAPAALAQAAGPVESATGLLNLDASAMPILLFLTDHKAETLRAVTSAVQRFVSAHPSHKAKFRLASGNAGVMAATNEVVAAAQTPILLWVFGAVIVLCLLTFRSFAATLCIVVPLAIVSWLAYALMFYLGIGLKTSTLPVVALGVGIGVDYGIYIFARLEKELKRGALFEDAMLETFKDTGSAVVFTGITLAIGVSLWMFSALKFQADMGILLTFMFVVNMLGAILLLPAMARWFWPHR